MRPLSIRARVLYLAIVFAVLLVGSVTLATYFFVADGMASSAQNTTWRLTRLASQAVAKATTTAKLQAASEGLFGEDREQEAFRLLMRTVPDLFTVGAVEEGAFALYVQDADESQFRLVWFSDDRAVVDDADGLVQTLSDRQPLQTGPVDRDLLTGMFTRADLGKYIVHVPLDLPDNMAGVIDVVYLPTREEGILDSARSPMFIVGVFAMMIAVLMMQVIMG
ncbi:MAG: hypothetical protein CVV27_20660, partial [Candidatus Melainabacteria bacterium HGW-Melainabacteria-1]